ncbi:MAG: hypothetical protein ACUVQY_07655 [Thermoproteota archaeon]
MGAWLAIALSNVLGGILSVVWIKYGEWAKAVIRKESITPSPI